MSPWLILAIAVSLDAQTVNDEAACLSMTVCMGWRMGGPLRVGETLACGIGDDVFTGERTATLVVENAGRPFAPGGSRLTAAMTCIARATRFIRGWRPPTKVVFTMGSVSWFGPAPSIRACILAGPAAAPSCLSSYLTEVHTPP